MKYKLRKEVRQRWLDDLRSGRYVQAQGELHSVLDGEENHYCCLGLLQLQYDEAVGGQQVYGGSDGHDRVVMDDFGMPTIGCVLWTQGGDAASNSVYAQEIDRGSYEDDEETHQALIELAMREWLTDLAQANDNDASFHEIAQVIEDNTEGV